jgi:hypothetical protein
VHPLLILAIVALEIGVVADLATGIVRALRPIEGRRPVSGGDLVARVLGAAPTLWVLGLALLVARAWIRIGERPVAGRLTGAEPFPDFVPANIGPADFPVHRMALQVGLVIMPLLLLGALATWLVRGSWRASSERRRAFAYAVAAAGACALLREDLGGFIGWFMD